MVILFGLVSWYVACAIGDYVHLSMNWFIEVN